MIKSIQLKKNISWSLHCYFQQVSVYKTLFTTQQVHAFRVNTKNDRISSAVHRFVITAPIKPICNNCSNSNPIQNEFAPIFTNLKSS